MTWPAVVQKIFWLAEFSTQDEPTRPLDFLDMPAKIYSDVSTTYGHKRYLDPANADYPVQSVDIVWDERHQGFLMALSALCLIALNTPAEMKGLPR